MVENKKITQLSDQYFAAIDLGSRNCLLVIAKQHNNELILLDSVFKTVNLGKDVVNMQKFTTESIICTINILQHYIKKIRQYPGIKYRIVTTAATRMATNKAILLSQARKRANVKIEVISAKQEAYFTAIGCSEIIDQDTKYMVIFDIGGCSTEIIFVHNNNEQFIILDSISIDIGIINISEKIPFRSSNSYLEIFDKITNIVKRFNQKNDIMDAISTNKCKLISASSTAITIASIYNNQKIYNIKKILETSLSFDDCQKISKYIQSMSKEELMINSHIGKNKMEYIHGGLAIFNGIYSQYQDHNINIIDKGVCWGIIQDLLTHNVEYANDIVKQK